jgi:penicillin amidase
MPIVSRLVRLLVVVLVVVIAAVASLVGFVTLRSLPQTDGRIALPDLEALVTVRRDAAGIAHIYGDTPHDLFLAQGYVHAQERLWQMEVWRHISSGRLSELFGKATLDQDRFIRTIGWRRAAERDLEALPADVRAGLDAYADGVNAYIDAHKGSLPLAFIVTAIQSGAGGIEGYELEPWTALDSLAWQKVQAWQLGGNFESEVFRLLADAKLGSEGLTDALFPAYRADRPVITPSGLPGSGGAGAASATGARGTATGAAASRSVAASASASVAGLDPEAAAGLRDVARIGERILARAGLDAGAGLASDHQVGSNNWVVGPGMSSTGAPLLANDPHLGIGMPSVWFMNGLYCRSVSDLCPYRVSGVSFPGVPGVVLGHNDRIAWGATNVDPDVQDLFIEELDPATPGNYLFAGESRPLLTRTETIKVAGGEDVLLEVRETHHGPLINDVDDRLAEVAPMALRWTATAEIDGTFAAVQRINVARSFEEFRAAFATYGAPSQNFVYADVDGHIGYVLPGVIPVRGDPADLGSRPRSGSDGQHEWTGYIPFDDLPWQLDPDPGLIVTANNAAVDDAYPYFVASEWDPGYRAGRITELLRESAANEDLTPQRIADIQMDAAVPRASLVRPVLETAEPTTADGRLLLERIRTWDGVAQPESLGATAYLAVEYELLRGIFDDELGDLARDYVGGSASWETMIRLLDTPDPAWWDDTTTTDTVETAAEILARAVDAAGADLRAAFGDPAGWSWGRAHRASFREQTLGTSGIAPLEWYFNKGPVEVGGAAGAVNNTYYRPSVAYPDPDDSSSVGAGLDRVFAVTNLPSYRLTIDMADLDSGRIVQTTGQSGNPFDSHYGDLIDEWASGGTVPLPFTDEAVEDATVSILELDP